MQYEQHVGQSDGVVEIEDKVGSPQEVGHFEEEPPEFGIKVDVGE